MVADAYAPASPEEEVDDSAYSPTRIPISPTARREASGKAHPSPLDLSPSSASAYLAAMSDTPPKVNGNSLSPRMASTPPITPTRKQPSSAGSNGGSGPRDLRRGQQGGAAAAANLLERGQLGAANLSGGMRSTSSSQHPQQQQREAGLRSATEAGAGGSAFPSNPPPINGHGPIQRRPSILGYNVSSRRASSFQLQAGGASPAGAMTNSRFLLTVVPPSHLPHDPPHPKSNPNCSGYGPPEHFKRGTLVPLYPTLSSQLAAIAREYGLPSTGGLVVYLLSTSDPASSVQAPLPGAAGFEGGPRISEEAWGLLWRRLFEEEEEGMLAESDDEEGYAPPVPPIPLSHRDGTSSADATFAPTFTDAQQQQRRMNERRVASESDQALFSDGGEHEVARTSFSSEGDQEGSVYSGGGGAVENVAGDHSGKARASAAAGQRSGLGRGHPSNLPSPSTSTRFASAPIPSTSRYSSYSQPNLRQPSRQSVRSTTSRFGRSSYAASGGRATSFSNYSTPQLGGEAFGAAVVVGKVEFDINRRGGKGKWYEGWMESSGEPTSSGAMSSAQPSPRTGVVGGEGSLGEGSVASTAERDAASTYDTDNTSPNTTAGSRTFDQSQLAPFSRGLRPLELSRSASPNGSVIDKQPQQQHHHHVEDQLSPASNAASGYSNAAMAGHGDDEETRSPSFAPSSSQRSRASSTASSQHHHEPEAIGYAPLEDVDVVSHGYAPLEDEETTSNPFESGRESRESREESDESDYDEQVEQVERGQQELGEREEEEEDEESERELEQEASGSRTATLHQGDPLGDVFPDDESTWRSLAEEPRLAEEREMVETTGLGIAGVQVQDLKGQAAPGIVERSTEDESRDEAGVAPPQDDVADVMEMLKSGQSQDRTDKVNLASPIHLDSSPSAPSSTGVFEHPSPSFDDSRPPFDHTQTSFDEKTSPFDSPFEPSLCSSAGPVDLAARRRSSQRPRFGSGASARALNLVSIDVRPPSTIHSSPEYAPQRKQRQGWTTIPPVVDRSMSASTSLASLDSYAQPESQRDSTIGLMENLDDLERALADLSPTTSRRSPAITQEEPTPEPSPQSLPPAVPAPSSVVAEAEQPESREVASPTLEEPTAPAPPFASSTSGTSSPTLGARPAFRYGASSSSSSSSPSLPLATLSTEPPARPPREDSLTVDESPVAQSSTVEEEMTPTTPSNATFPDSIPLAGAFSSPEQIVVPPTEAGTPGDPGRTPRTSSLSRGTPAAHQVALPPSPMPPQSESAWQAATSPAFPSAPFAAAAPHPASPRQRFVSQRPAPPMPPVPTKEDEITFPEPPPRSPKSPGGAFRSLRSKKSWQKKDKDLDLAMPNSPDLSGGDSSESKSPVTAFFHKPAFQKLGGMFQKKSGAESSPDSTTSPPTTAPPEVPSIEQHVSAPQAVNDTADPISPPFDRLTSSPPLETFEPPALPRASRSNSLDVQSITASEPDRPSVDYSNISTSSFSGDFPPTSSPTVGLLEARPTLAPVDSTGTLRPIPSAESFVSALSTLPVRQDSASSANSPSTSAGPLSPVTPTDVTFPTSYGAPTSSAPSTSYTPLPPLPYNPIDSSGDPTSPRSDYGGGSSLPRTPMQPTNYAASAPATPATWTRPSFEPGSRFGSFGKSSRAGAGKVNTDLDALLSQMHEIDFGGEEEVAESGATAASEGEMREEPKESAQEEVEQQQHLEEQHEEDVETFEERRRKMQSSDFSSLGGLMLGSPPLSPSLPTPPVSSAYA